MTMQTTTVRNTYTGTGSSATYAYTFLIRSSSDLIVTRRNTSGAETLLALNTDYTVTGVGVRAGGTITLTAGNLTSGYVLTIRRKASLTQLLDLRNQGSYLPETVEDQFDTLVMASQQQQDELDRSVKLPESLAPSAFDPRLPATIPTANASLVVNPSGTGWALGPSTDQINSANVYGPLAVASASAAAASQTAAAASATSATASATSATASATAAAGSATAAAGSATAAAGSATAAATSATNAANSYSSLISASSSANAANSLVLRDASGNFAAGTITATFVGNLTGTASTATNATLAANLSLAGGTVGNVLTWNGTTWVSSAPTGGSGGGLSIYANTGALPASPPDGTAATTADTNTIWAFNAGLTQWRAVASPATVTGASAANSATALNTASSIVARDGSGNFAAGTITANLTGNVTGNVTGNTSGTAASITGNLTGDVTSTGMATTVASVGGKTASAVAQSVTDTTAATTSDVGSTIVKRNASGQITCQSFITDSNLFITAGRAELVGAMKLAFSANSSAIGAELTDTNSTNAYTGAFVQVTNSASAVNNLLVLKGKASQSGDYFQVKDSAGTTLAKIDSSGKLFAQGITAPALTGPAKNYIQYSNFENNAATGWHTMSGVTVSSGVVSGTPTISATNAVDAATAASITTFGATATNPLAGTYSLQVGATGALTVGQGVISDACTIDREDRAKVQSYRFAFEVVTANSGQNFSGTSSNTWAVVIWDTVNSAWIQPAGTFNLVQSSGVGIAQGTFQTPSNMTSFRIALVCINATAAAAFAMNLDDFYVGPQMLATGPAMGDLNSNVPAVTASGLAAGTVTQATRRVGDCLEFFVKVPITGAGSGNFLLTLPAGYVIDMAKLGASTLGVTGTAAGFINGSQAYTGSVYVLSSTTLTVYGDSAASRWGAGIPAAWTSGGEVDLHFVLPIVGWSSNTAMSADTDTRVCAMRATSSSALTVVANTATTIPFTSGQVTFDTHSGWDATNNWYLASITGYYKIHLRCQGPSGDNYTQSAYRVNSGTDVVIGQGDGSTSWVSASFGSDIVKLNAGDKLQYRAISSGTSIAVMTASLERLSGAAVVAASETVAGRYYGSTSTITGSFGTVTYANKDFDSHGAYASGTLTIPVSGKFLFNAGVIFGGTWALNSTAQIAIYKNGVEITQYLKYAGGAVSNESVTISDVVPCFAGDLITIRAAAGASSPNINNAATDRNWFSWARVGN